MPSISEQFANVGKQSFQSQIAILQKLSQKALESSQKIIALNISTGKTLLSDNHDVAAHWIHSQHPFQFWLKDAHELQPGLHHLFHYERELANILTNNQAEMLTFAFSEVAEIQGELAGLATHLHEHNKDKQDVMKQAAHAYTAEIKSLYAAKPETGAADPASKNGAAAEILPATRPEAAASTEVTSSGKPARTKATGKLASKAAAKAAPEAKADPVVAADAAVAAVAEEVAADVVTEAAAGVAPEVAAKVAEEVAAEVVTEAAAEVVAEVAAEVVPEVEVVAELEAEAIAKGAAEVVAEVVATPARPPMPRPGKAKREARSEAANTGEAA